MVNEGYNIVSATDEATRLHTLNALNILDTAPEPFYDKITRSVASQMNAPIALISLVDQDRLFFKSAYGTSATEVNRANTFCSAAITSPDVLVVEDALADQRFIGCPIVKQAPHARFYAGAPIILSTGIRIGTVCFVYTEPNNALLEPDKTFLQDMASLAAQYIELRLTKEFIDPMNLLPMSSVAIHAINDIVYIKKNSVTAYSIELFGSAKVSELVIALGEPTFFKLLEIAKEIIKRLLPPPACHMYSLGMDRILCLLDGTSYDSALKIEQSINKELSQNVIVDGISITSTPNIGLAYTEGRKVKPTALIRMAIAAMEDSRKYPGQVAIYSEQAESEIKRRVQLIHDFPTSLKLAELSIHYQPQICLGDNTVAGAEALIRWKHPELGNIPPFEFIPELEKANLIHLLTNWIIEKVILDLEQWSTLGESFNISINVSAKDFQQEGWINKLKANQDLVNKSDRIHFELTETSAISNMEEFSHVIKQLNEIGIKTHIDDFGTGHSTLTYLSKLDIYAIKLDQEFVMPMANSSKDQLIVKYTCKLAKALGFRLIAEGVENEEVNNILRSFGVDFSQGYLFAKPMNIESFNTWLSDWNATKVKSH